MTVGDKVYRGKHPNLFTDQEANNVPQWWAYLLWRDEKEQEVIDAAGSD